MTTNADAGRAGASMTPDQMTELIERHITAEAAGDIDGAVAVYTDDVEHDTAGAPTGPLHGREGARGFYEHLTANVRTLEMRKNHEYFSENACVVEHQWVGTVTGELIGIPGNGKQIEFRMPHVFEFRDGLISRENVWLDGGSIAAQLTA